MALPRTIPINEEEQEGHCVPLDRSYGRLLLEGSHELFSGALRMLIIRISLQMMGMLPQLKGITLLSLHGKIPANKRNGLVEKFTMAESAVLLCTDVAARGLDFNDHPIGNPLVALISYPLPRLSLNGHFRLDCTIRPSPRSRVLCPSYRSHCAYGTRGQRCRFPPPK